MGKITQRETVSETGRQCQVEKWSSVGQCFLLVTWKSCISRSSYLEAPLYFIFKVILQMTGLKYQTLCCEFHSEADSAENEAAYLRRYVTLVTTALMNPTSHCFPVPERPCVFTQSVHREEEEWKACVTPAPSLCNFLPHFPPRPLNLTAIWWFAAITIHKWVKINLWDASLRQGFEVTFGETLLPDSVLVTPLWFTVSADDSTHIICNQSRVRIYNIILVKIQGWGKNRKSTTSRDSEQK